VCLVLNQRGTCKGQTKDDLNKLLASPNGEIIEPRASAPGKTGENRIEPRFSGATLPSRVSEAGRCIPAQASSCDDVFPVRDGAAKPSTISSYRSIAPIRIWLRGIKWLR
jgi:hypothetical protein